MWPIITAGILLGFAGSFHCAGMCGPIALSLPTHSLTRAKKYMVVFLYHTGRIATYTILGLIVSLLGRRFYIAGFQQVFSITAGCIILLIVLSRGLHQRLAPLPYAQKFFNTIQSLIWYYWNKPFPLKFLLIGMLNGLLPCGMVYFALVTAASFAAALNSIFFVLAFGAGTLPMMLSVYFFGTRWLSMRVRNNLKKAVPVFIVFIGIILVLRGLNLGIPFISPLIGKAPAEAVSCH